MYNIYLYICTDTEIKKHAKSHTVILLIDSSAIRQRHYLSFNLFQLIAHSASFKPVLAYRHLDHRELNKIEVSCLVLVNQKIKSRLDKK